jgi:hypothetical protein
VLDLGRAGGGVTLCVVTAGNVSGKLMFTLIGVGFKQEGGCRAGKKRAPKKVGWLG